jgi:hypothetical protein
MGAITRFRGQVQLDDKPRKAVHHRYVHICFGPGDSWWYDLLAPCLVDTHVTPQGKATYYRRVGAEL